MPGRSGRLSLHRLALLGLSTALGRSWAALALVVGALNLRDGLRAGGGFVLSIPAE
ncbi:hypothetical protein [Azotobacter beijerinckii]|uniref:hypothetical protein n=1 Tax=Azotobacter beijerinckii TaxID=170623 RepID=UPI002952998E|nr:hypothetical protein [Azotobacter beijerinckii]MDV7212068.1 hypothetical protein [Azotobacter beijerinckii]